MTQMKIKVTGIRSTIRDMRNQFKKEVATQGYTATRRLVSDLKAETPVDTGAARDAWTIQLRTGTIWKVVNDKDYIERLNAGSSRQAPAHFVERTALKHGKPIGTIIDIT